MKVQNVFLDVFVFVIGINIQIGPAWGGFQVSSKIRDSSIFLKTHISKMKNSFIRELYIEIDKLFYSTFDNEPPVTDLPRIMG